MEFTLSKISEECARLGNRRTRALAVGGGLLLLMLLKQLRRAYIVSRLRRKVAERRREREEELNSLAENLCKNGLSIDDRNAILNLSLKELQQRLQRGTLSAQVVLKAYQSRALQAQQFTNCAVGLIHNSKELAEACDKSMYKNRILHGVPVSLKENYGVAGYDTTGGMVSLVGHPCQEDAVIVKVLKAQGAIPFIRTNIPQTMMSTECSNPVYGVSVNPFDHSRGPGGSSGGEAALLASEGSILGFGTDIGGSIRIPANMCGVYGLKPTYGRISSKGLFSFGMGQNLIQACPGPLARDVHSLALAMEALLSPLMYDLDPSLPRMPFNKEVYRNSRPLRIGYFLDTGVVQSVPACQRAVHLAKQVLQQQGHTFVQFEPPSIGNAMSTLYVHSVFGDGGKSYLDYLNNDLGDVCSVKLWAVLSLPQPVRWVLSTLLSLVDSLAGKAIWNCKGVDSVSDWWKHTVDLENYREKFTKQWKAMRLDALISPGYAYPAAPSGFAAEAEGGSSYTTIYNILNFPAGSVPVTKVTEKDEEDLQHYKPRKLHERVVKKVMVGSKGLPVNVQCVALPFQEELVLRLMRDLETGIANQNIF